MTTESNLALQDVAFCGMQQNVTEAQIGCTLKATLATSNDHHEDRLMYTQRDVIKMLELSGSVKIHSNGHLKYKLPTGEIFVLPKTPSGHLSYNNAQNLLRKKLMGTHPEIANMGRSIPKTKRSFSNTLADFISPEDLARLKGTSSPGATSPIPGSAPIEADFQVLEPPPPVVPSPVVKDEPETNFVQHKPYRKPLELKPSAHPPKTLSPEQLTEANRILHTQGDAVMNAYLNQCRDGLVPVTHDLIVERAAKTVATTQQKPRENLQMDHLLERALKEQGEVKRRLQAYDSQIADLNAKKEADGIRELQLDDFIEKHKAFLAVQEQAAQAAADILQFLPPEKVEAAPASLKLMTAHKKRMKGANNFAKVQFGIRELRANVFPLLRRKGMQTFSVDDLFGTLAEVGLPGPQPTRTQFAMWISAECQYHSGKLQRTAERGRYAFRTNIVTLPPAVPVLEAMHA